MMNGPVMEGAVLKADEENRFVLLMAYSPNHIPQRGQDQFIDVARPMVLEKACWRFMDNGAKAGLWHEPGHENEARVVENYIYRNPEPWVIKGNNGQEQVIKQGDWIVGFILSPTAWGLYKQGLIGGASPQGSAGRRRADPGFVAQLRNSDGR
ncbi:MAG: hypothetical protein KGL39_44265 [Patescibacteria group bacterium]|nr:hypothetical protein [Patescibacteria group bacterium]